VCRASTFKIEQHFKVGGKKFTNLRVKSAKPYITAFCIGVFNIRGTGEMLAIFNETVLCSCPQLPPPPKKIKRVRIKTV
jgi:hypothetical protein